MNIRVLPYIDHNLLARSRQRAQTSTVVRTSSDSTSEAGSTSSSEGSTSFQMSLANAQRMMEALTVDLLASQDRETIEKAAEILSDSSVPQLQKLGQNLINTQAGTGTPIAEDAAAKTATDSENTGFAPGTVTSADSGSTPSGSAAAAGSGSASSNSAAASGSSSASSNSAAASGSTSSASATEVLSDKADTNKADTAETADKSTVQAANKAASTLGCPSSMKSYFVEASEKYNVDVALLMSIAKAESDFTSNAVSSAGATGVMQLMPASARELGVSDLYDAHSNILGGAREISSYLKRYNGDLTLSLAAYNAGSGNVRKYGGVPPFTETQNYIKKVTKYYNNAKS